MNAATRKNPDALLLTIPMVCDLLNVGETTVSKLISTRELRSAKIGSRRLVSRRDLERYVEDKLAGRATKKRR